MVKISLSLAALLFFTTPSITGRWRVHDTRGTEFLINFKKDSTFTAYTTTGKVLIVGNYRSDKDTFLVNDNNCNGAYWGKYIMHFHGDDSMTFTVLADTCAGRAMAVNGIAVARLKQNEPAIK